MTEAGNYNLSEYYASHLNDRRYFFRKLSPEEIMKWSNSLISKPLLNINENLEETAIQIYKNLMSYMGDRRSSKKPIQHLIKHLKLTQNAPEDIKDEAYVQVLKQTHENKNYDNCMKGWNFLAVLASCYAPSLDLYYSILNYLIYEIRNNLDQNIVKRCNYILHRLTRTFEQKRKQIPSVQEIQHIEHMKPIMFPVYFFSGSFTMVPTESYTTVKELKTTIMRKMQLNISRIPYYSLYEICNKPDVIEERFLDDLDRIVDITAIWAKEEADCQIKNTSIDFKIYLKILLYYGYNENDLDTITMHYVQTCYDVNKGKLKLSEEDVIALAGLQLMSNYNKSSHEEIYRQIEKNTERFVPMDIYKSSQISYWCKKIMDYYTGLKPMSRLEAKLSYLEHLKQNSLWEAHQYYCSYSKVYNQLNPNNLPDKMIIGIKPTGMTIQDMDRNELLFITYASIASWGVNNLLFVVVLQKNETEIVKYYFESNQVRNKFDLT